MEDLLEEAKEGNTYAFKQLIESIANDLYRVARTRLNNDDDINDAIQNTMIITYKNIKRKKDIQFIKPWIMHVLINECNKIYNTNKKHNVIYNELVRTFDLVSPDTSIQDACDKLSFEKWIEKLDYKERLIITLYYNSDYSCEQIATILKMNYNTVKSKLLRAKGKLKKFYEEEMENG